MQKRHPLNEKRYRRALGHWVRRQRLKHSWPLLLWLVACGFAAWLYFNNPTPDNRYIILAMVDAEAVGVSPTETARLMRLHVRPGQTVAAGDVIAEMDTLLVDFETAVDAVDRRRLRTLFDGEQQDGLLAVRQSQQWLAEVEAEIAACRQDWARESAEYQALLVEQERRERLRAGGLIDDMVFGELLPAIANLEKATAQYPERLETLERQRQLAAAVAADMHEWQGLKATGGVIQAIAQRVDETQIHRLLETAAAESERRREAYTLRAPKDGVVSAIYYGEGHVVAAGVPVVRMAAAHPTRITGFLNDAQIGGMPIGSRVWVRSSGRTTRERVAAVMDAISPEIHSTAHMISSMGQVAPVRARRAHFHIENPHAFVGGEMVYLYPARLGFFIGRADGLRQRLFGDEAPETDS